MKFSRLAALFTVFVLLITVGCNSLYKGAVTLSQAEDAVMKQWATLHNDHMTTPDIDTKVMAAHANFNAAKLAAAAALRSYAAGGDKANYIRLLEAARAAIDPLFSILQPLMSQSTASSLKLQVLNAKAP